MKKQIYTFLGLPAAGKGTQVDLFAKKRDLQVIGVGDLIRDEIENGDKNDPIVKEMIERYDEGLVQTDEVVFDLIKRKLNHFLNSDKEGIVLDNFPFTKKQAEYLDKYDEEFGFEKPIIIEIHIAPKTAINRITKRHICPNCNAIYSDTKVHCKKCGKLLVTRADDNEDTARTRIEEYLPQIEEIKKHYTDNGTVIVIDGEKSIEEVTKEIDQIIE